MIRLTTNYGVIDIELDYEHVRLRAKTSSNMSATASTTTRSFTALFPAL